MQALLRVASGLLFVLFAAGPAAASTVQTIYAFNPTKDGSYQSNLVASPDGRVFGAAVCPETNFCVFELDPPRAAATPWTYQIIFTLPTGRVLQSPGRNLALSRSGHIFAAAEYYNSARGYSPAVIYELIPPTSHGAGWTAVERANNPHIGTVPLTAITLYYADSSNVLYGFGHLSPDRLEKGVVLRLAPLSTNPAVDLPSILTTTCAPGESIADDCNYTGNLILAADGSFYGTTEAGLFRLTPPASPGRSWTMRTLVRAAIAIDSADRSLNLYGFSGFGGSRIVKIMPPSWTVETLADLGQSLGNDLTVSLLQDRSGLLFGLFSLSGGSCCGGVFRMGPQAPAHPGVVHSFSGPDGAYPQELTQAVRPDGSNFIVGVTSSGGLGWTGIPGSGHGVVFQVVP